MEWSRMVRELHAANPPKTPEDRHALAFLSLRLCGGVARRLKPRRDGARPPTRCRAAVDYLDRHFREDAPLEQLAELCHMSRTLFFRTFRREMGVTPGNYRVRRRIREAQKLLLRKELSSEAIATALGWESAFYFSRIFKRETGLSPRDYRRRHLFI